MSIEEENKARQRRVWEEVINNRNLEIITELFASNYFYRSPLGMDVKGPEGFKQSMANMLKAFPDLHCTIDDMFAIEDKVVTRFTMQGTFTGKYGEITPTGKKFTVTCIIITRWVDGKEVEAWESMDTLAFYQQLGISPPNQ
jgi:steroid delta-isomerase-like uncharacterized protein